MKLFVLASAGSLGWMFASIAGAHPHSLKHKALKRAVVTEVSYTTVTVANVIVWVDENGVPVETTTVAEPTTIAVDSTVATSSIAEPLPTPADLAVVDPPAPTPMTSASAPPAEPAPPASSTQQPAPESAVVTEAISSTSATSVVPAPIETSAPPAPSPAPLEVQEPSIAPPAPPEPPMPSVPAAPPSVAPAVPSVVAEPPPTERPEAAQSGDRFPIGVTYDPYKTGACKTEQDFRDNWAQMRSYGIVRIYGMACGQIPLAVELAKANNQKLMAGIWLSHGGDNEDIQTVVREITQAVRNRAGGDWSVIALVSVENERVNEHEFTASEAVDGVNRARQALRFSGYNGPVGAVETVPAMLDNPSICENSDLALVNVHSFFDANTRAEDSGQFVQDQVARVRDKCGGKRVIVTEAGWPHQGDSHDLAVPSRANQRAAIDSIRAKFDHDLFLFNAFDSEWKTDWAGSFSAERYWGILG